MKKYKNLETQLKTYYKDNCDKQYIGNGYYTIVLNEENWIIVDDRGKTVINRMFNFVNNASFNLNDKVYFLTNDYNNKYLLNITDINGNQEFKEGFSGFLNIQNPENIFITFDEKKYVLLNDNLEMTNMSFDINDINYLSVEMFTTDENYNYINELAKALRINCYEQKLKQIKDKYLH